LALVHHRVPFLALATAGLMVAGCGSTQTRSAAPSAAQTDAALRGSPPPLAALHAQAAQLLSGGSPAFRARLQALRGQPVVINKWASWCGPCQSEFPVFQRVSVTLGRQVAFLGLDARDQHPAAAAFLRRFPVSYPSYEDSGEKISNSLQAASYFPQTVYIDRQGRQVYVHAGPYLSEGELTRDIRFYVLR
jgi:cytochrome c biogenesis protein CcmG, thiol:disulfide interchange protein DsbE